MGQAHGGLCVEECDSYCLADLPVDFRVARLPGAAELDPASLDCRLG